jgi:hypothetical protein
MDYAGETSRGVVEGITYYDHSANPGQPTCWHVRDDGWMGAAVCLNNPVMTTKKQPLVLRYLLHAHGGPIDSAAADKALAAFDGSPAYEVIRSEKKHVHAEVRRRQKK